MRLIDRALCHDRAAAAGGNRAGELQVPRLRKRSAQLFLLIVWTSGTFTDPIRHQS